MASGSPHHFERTAKDFKAISWSDGTIYWPNHDGSHHFAAARYIAGLRGQPVPITASLTSYSISHDAVATLADAFFTWVLPDHDDTWAFVRMVHQYGTPLGVASMPLPYRDDLLILLSKHSSSATDIAAIMDAFEVTPFRLFTDNWLNQQREAMRHLPKLFSH